MADGATGEGNSVRKDAPGRLGPGRMNGRPQGCPYYNVCSSAFPALPGMKDAGRPACACAMPGHKRGQP